MSSIIALDDYNKAKEYREKYLKALRSTFDFTSKSHHDKALKYYEKAANAGNEDAMYDLAVYYANQCRLVETTIYSFAYYETDENVKKALDWLKKAAALNHEYSINLLIQFYTVYVKDDNEKLYYLLKQYENGYSNDIEPILKIYESVNLYIGISFLKGHIEKNNIDIKTWEYSIRLAKYYEKIDQIDKRNEIYRIIASNENFNINNVSAYMFVADEYRSKSDYVNAISIYKKINALSTIKEMAKDNKGISPIEYFEYVNEINYITEIADCYLKGFGTDKDEKKGFEMLKSNYSNWNGNYFYNKYINASILVSLAECYYFGRGTERNIKEALNLFLEAEKKPDIKNYDILYAICWCYNYLLDYPNAFKRLYAYTTRDGIVANWAYYLIASYYHYGWGTSVNYTKAFENYKKGADKNHKDCFNQVGNCYYNGIGVTRNYQKAFEYYKKGYEHHKDIYCAYNLGLCYENGYGCVQDIFKAYEWYKISESGYKHGKEAVLRLKPEIEKINQQTKKIEDEQKKIKELTEEIVEKINELKANQVKTEVTVKTEVVEGSAKETLNELIGLTSVKKEIQELENFIKVMNMRKKRGLPTTDISKHMVFTGNPGTGKTTVARIVAQIYKENGILEKGHLVETDREGLVGQYIGETGKKTRKVIESAMGGVLFIDEAYSLIPKDSDKDYGPEAVATLLKMMEDYKNDFVVIVAGYEDEMKFFIDSNPGLKSRFTSYIHFPDYTPEEMQAIFKLKASKDMFEISEDAEKELIELWEKSYEYKNLGNGRCVRNVYEKVQRLQSNRIIEQNLTNDEDFIRILKEDIPSAEDIFR